MIFPLCTRLRSDQESGYPDVAGIQILLDFAAHHNALGSGFLIRDCDTTSFDGMKPGELRREELPRRTRAKRVKKRRRRKDGSKTVLPPPDPNHRHKAPTSTCRWEPQRIPINRRMPPVSRTPVPHGDSSCARLSCCCRTRTTCRDPALACAPPPRRFLQRTP